MTGWGWRRVFSARERTLHAAEECVFRGSAGAVVHDGQVTSTVDPVAIAEAIAAFFARHEVAGLRLPSGWFGRPHDNLHQLTEAVADAGRVVVRLDGQQMLILDAVGASLAGGVLRITIRGGDWRWTEYGGNEGHHEALEPGVVEFHAPFHP